MAAIPHCQTLYCCNRVVHSSLAAAQGKRLTIDEQRGNQSDTERYKLATLILHPRNNFFGEKSCLYFIPRSKLLLYKILSNLRKWFRRESVSNIQKSQKCVYF